MTRETRTKSLQNNGKYAINNGGKSDASTPEMPDHKPLNWSDL